jgi:hypothetical protein
VAVERRKESLQMADDLQKAHAELEALRKQQVEWQGQRRAMRAEYEQTIASLKQEYVNINNDNMENEQQMADQILQYESELRKLKDVNQSLVLSFPLFHVLHGQRLF